MCALSNYPGVKVVISTMRNLSIAIALFLCISTGRSENNLDVL